MLLSDLELNRTSNTALVQQLFSQIRGLIESGALTAGSRLPTSRQLAGQLDLGRNTVIAAYDLLVADGYLQSFGRRGTFVSEASQGFVSASQKPVLPPLCPGCEGSNTRGVVAPPLRLSRSAEQLIAIRRRSLPRPPMFQPGLPEVRSFPHDLWGRCLRRAARQLHQDPTLGSYAHYHGLPQLRSAIINHVAVSRGVVARAEQVIVFSSAQAALDLVARLLLNEGDVALHEEPGYAGMMAPLRGVHGDCRPIAVEKVDAFTSLDHLVADGAVPRLLYATPSHQFPTGKVMPLKDRLALLSFAARHHCPVLEDDYDSEFHFSNAPLSCLQGLDRHNLVIYMGTFAKSLMPSLRIAYLVVPNQMVEPIRHMQRNMGSVPGFPVQMALAHFLTLGHFRSHVRDMNKLYESRRDCLFDALTEHCSDWLQPVVPEGGIQMPVLLKMRALQAGLTDQSLLAALEKRGLECSALSSLYWSGRMGAKQGLLLGYAASDEHEIETGVKNIAQSLEAFAS